MYPQHASARSHVSFLTARQHVPIREYMRQLTLKTSFVTILRGDYIITGQVKSNVKTVIYRCVTRSLISALCTNMGGCPNPVVKIKKLNNCSPV